MTRPRWTLKAEAVSWRFLMNIGMYLHTFGIPHPAPYAFKRSIPVTICPKTREGKTISSSKGDTFDLYFYVPEGYSDATKEPRKGNENGYPVVVTFHGGGFTIGSATDDCRWADYVCKKVDAVVVCVDYRLAPEYSFPSAVEDGCDAIMWLVDHAKELKLDSDRIVVSGFSAGGNMAFTVPLRWQYELRLRRGLQTAIEPQADDHDNRRNTVTELPPNAASEGAYSSHSLGGKIVAICAWYPSVDFTNTREERHNTNIRKEKEMPKFFTDLFDASYLYPPVDIDVHSPYLSPGVAPDEMLQGLPEDIIVYTCEWDSLHAEGDRLQRRLREEPLNKRVAYRMVEGVGHAWDKSPTKRDPITDVVYSEACAYLRIVLYGSEEPFEDDTHGEVKDEGENPELTRIGAREAFEEANAKGKVNVSETPLDVDEEDGKKMKRLSGNQTSGKADDKATMTGAIQTGAKPDTILPVDVSKTSGAREFNEFTS